MSVGNATLPYELLGSAILPPSSRHMRQSSHAEFEDRNGGCPKVNASQPRPSYLLPLNPSKDPWSWYQRTLTFQASAC